MAGDKTSSRVASPQRRVPSACRLGLSKLGAGKKDATLTRKNKLDISKKTFCHNGGKQMGCFHKGFPRLFILFVVLAVALPRLDGSPLSIRLWGGMNYLLAKDVNDGNKGRNGAISYNARITGYVASGQTKPIQIGNEFGGDLIIYFTPRIGLGFGAGYVRGREDSEITFSRGTYLLTMTSKPDMTAIPLRAGLFLNLPLGGRAYFNLNLGAGYYLSKYSYEWEIKGAGYWDDVVKITHKVSANGFGFHGGLGFELELAANLALFIEGYGRSAKIGHFSGTVEKYYWEGWTYSGEGKLYASDSRWGPDIFTQLDVRETAPSGPYVSNVREATVDFSGVYAIAGIRIKF